MRNIAAIWMVVVGTVALAAVTIATAITLAWWVSTRIGDSVTANPTTEQRP